MDINGMFSVKNSGNLQSTSSQFETAFNKSRRRHDYGLTKKSCQNSIFATLLGGEYFSIQCSCGLIGVGTTPSKAMEHINRLHEHPEQPTLLFFSPEYLDLDEENENY